MSGAAASAHSVSIRAGVDAALEREVSRFLHLEAELLDARRLEDWVELFVPDGRLWVPSRSPTAGGDEPDPSCDVSIIYEQVPRLRVRVARLLSGKEYAQDPPSATIRQVSNVVVEAIPTDGPGADADGADGADFVARSVCVLHERWGTRPLLVLPARAAHRLAHTDDGLRIVEKRLDLLEPDRYFENLAFLL